MEEAAYLRCEASKIRLSEKKTKFWSSEYKEMLAFSLLSRDKIRRSQILFGQSQ